MQSPEVSAVVRLPTAERDSSEATPAPLQKTPNACPASTSESAVTRPPFLVHHDNAVAPSPLTTLGSSSGAEQQAEVSVHRIQFEQ